MGGLTGVVPLLSGKFVITRMRS